MLYLHRICALALLAACPLTVHGQTPPVRINVDHAAFAYSDFESILELYLAVEAATLDFEYDDRSFVADLPLYMALHRSSASGTGETVWSDSLILQFQLPDTSSISSGQHFMHRIRTPVPPGEYELGLSAAANEERRTTGNELMRSVVVPDFKVGGEPAISDLTLATHITSSGDRENTFYKNGLVIRPSANQLFGQSLDRLFYYAEAYQLREAAGSDGEYTVHAHIAEANGMQVVDELEHASQATADSAEVLTGHFDISGLPSGSYFLRVAVLSDEDEAVVERSRKFFVYNPDVKRTERVAVAIDFDTTSDASLTEGEVDQRLVQIEIIANDLERQRIKRLPDLDAKRRFLMDFWEKRDDRPGTPVNEFKNEFFRRIEYANERYASNSVEGWRSDRGRVIVRYGLPSEIEPHLYDRTLAPHEIWEYDDIPGEGQALFVFADVEGFGRFELLHSTVAGERSVPNWRDELSRR